MNKNTKKTTIWLILFLIVIIVLLVKYNKKPAYKTENGLVFGTVYNITYQSNDSLKNDIDATLSKFDGSMSMFNDTSIVSKINHNVPVTVDSLFQHCFTRAMRISSLTNGDFDVTVCPLVNAWGFGFKNKKFPTAKQLDSLRKYIGYEKVRLINKHVVKSNPKVMLDFSAIAKGYAVDVISDLFIKKGLKNYMIDIGGEVVVKGKNPQGQPWKIGINKPTDDSLSINKDIETILNISDRAIATSGNYHNFYYHNKKKYSHEINPHTGYPALNEVLSSTVIAKDCMTADALATAVMVMGLQKAKMLLEKITDIDLYIIYRNNTGGNSVYYSDGLKKYLKKN